MKVTSIARCSLYHANPRTWDWWQLPVRLRTYVALVSLAALACFCYAVSRASWVPGDLLKFVIIMVGGLVSVAATPRTAYAHGTLTRDFITAWVLPAAVLLPPAYAMAAPVPLLILTQWRINRGRIYRRVFTAAALGSAYGAGSELFHAITASVGGLPADIGHHPLTWAAAVIACEMVGGWGHRLVILLAMKIADPSTSVIVGILKPDALLDDFAEHNLGVVITVLLAFTTGFVVFAVPLWLLVRRFMVHTHLLAQSRTDTKTGLLNSSAWEGEAKREMERAARTEQPLSVALIDIDHFKRVNDTHGHLAGDVVLRAVSDAIRDQLRSYDVAGRFGGEEFVVLLPHAGESGAFRVAERLRTHIAGLSIPVTGGRRVQLTVSIGVAALDESRCELTNLMAAADTALYRAKQGGRNQTQVTPSELELVPAIPSPRWPQR